MSGRKNVLPPYQIITNGDMSGSITSKVTEITYLDNICISLVFTGTPTGTFEIQGSNTFQEDTLGNIQNTGTWTPMSFSTSLAASGAAGNILLDMFALSFPYIRVVYTPASGTGTLNATISGKQG